MNHYFFDCTVLVKRYIPETGTVWVRSISETGTTNNIFITSSSRLEFYSAVLERRRDKSISPKTAKAVRTILDHHSHRQYVVLAMTEAVMSRAEDLLETHLLSVNDSVQLASAIELNKRLLAAGLTALIFLSSDPQLLTIANSEGLIIDDPNAHP